MLSFRLFGNFVEKLWFSVLATSLWGDSCKMSLRFLGEAVFLVRARRLYRMGGACYNWCCSSTYQWILYHNQISIYLWEYIGVISKLLGVVKSSLYPCHVVTPPHRAPKFLGLLRQKVPQNVPASRDGSFEDHQLQEGNSISYTPGWRQVSMAMLNYHRLDFFEKCRPNWQILWYTVVCRWYNLI